MRYHGMGCSTRGEMIMADISVPYWNIVDVNMLCEGARLIGFDLDNTLARHRTYESGHGRMLLCIDIID